MNLRFVLVTGEEDERTTLLKVGDALRGGVTTVQLRHKSGDAATFFSQALACREICDAWGVLLIINDRLDIALACGAGGVHLGQRDLPIAAARALVPETFVIGATVHTPREARSAQDEGASYLGVGAIWPSKTKSNTIATGLEGLKAIREVTTLPLVGIGGLNTPERARSVLEAGADGVAVSNALWFAPQVHVQAAAYRSVLDRPFGSEEDMLVRIETEAEESGTLSSTKRQ